jgi:hypothetical protein
MSKVRVTGTKLSILGYRSMGLSVPDVITTDWKCSNTGLQAPPTPGVSGCRRSRIPEQAGNRPSAAAPLSQWL